MKKNILFVCASLKVGGAEKSLVNLLNMMDYMRYSVDLLLFQNQGEFLEQVPEDVHIIECGKMMKALYDKVPKTPDNISMTIYKYIATVVERLKHSAYDDLRAHRWVRFYKKVCEPLEKDYDVAVAFQSGEPSYFVMDKVQAKRKVTYFHTDISNIELAYDLEYDYLRKFDLIVTISEKCVASIVKYFPEFSNKTVSLENPSSSEFVKKLAGNNIPKEYEQYKQAIKIVSVGRLVNIKGYDMAIDAAKILVDKGYDIQWFFIGEGVERKKLKKQIEDLQLENNCHLLGLKSNPYPYIRYADILVQSSRYEGKSVVLDEAKILEKLIVVTNYNSVEDQIEHEVNGLIAEMSETGIADAIERIVGDKNLVSSIIDNYVGEVMKVTEKEKIEIYCNKIIEGV